MFSHGPRQNRPAAGSLRRLLLGVEFGDPAGPARGQTLEWKESSRWLPFARAIFPAFTSTGRRRRRSSPVPRHHRKFTVDHPGARSAALVPGAATRRLAEYLVRETTLASWEISSHLKCLQFGGGRIGTSSIETTRRPRMIVCRSIN
jgi:hypothetical protein